MKNSSSCKRDTTTKGVRSQVGRATTTCGRQLAHLRITNAQVKDLGIRLWSYLPLTRTQHKPLTCGFATPSLSPARYVPPTPSAKRPWSLRDRLDGRNIAGLITADR